ncbi:hypothetical protein CAL29_20840 [Bordetella genomosp. 10]|uniref:TapA domain-containing protein n=1 Tax=Bordetella genomosp. 10 TaxID=1416804 RepID=A0A261RZX7_9BORD|nr:DUF3613 domain-containing protein [Bordetella genomosp. 10]OZI30475.1 hypothetical protein CAL29_20840 [Bordetella genomosp. 10]
MILPRLSCAAALLLVATAASAQGNAPLTGTMASPGAAVPGAATAAGGATLTERPVVRQVSTPMPVSGADTAPPPSGPAYAAPRPSAAAPAPADEGPTGAGGITRALLAAQADGRRAAPLQPMLGPVATASWERYLDSFNQPIPQWFRERVDSSRGSSAQ